MAKLVEQTCLLRQLSGLEFRHKQRSGQQKQILKKILGDKMSRDEMLLHLVVQPEGEPGHNHDHEAGDVDGHQVEGQLPREGQVNLRSN